MQLTLPLQEMTLSEKMMLLEDIWNDLAKEDSGYSPPSWHGGVLKIRKERIKAGEIGFTDWEVAKKEIRDRVS
jgi:hypothetical protein